LHSGRHFLQIPGPTNVPDRVLRAMDRPVVDHRSAEFAKLGTEVLQGMRSIFKTAGPVVIYTGSGTGGWEAAIVNTLSLGDRVLLLETGYFSQLWRQVIEKFGVEVEYVSGNWRRGADPSKLEARLMADRDHSLKAVLIVHNETSTGVISRIGDLRRAMNRAGHPALLIVDAISSLGSADFRLDEWEVDVAVAASQKGLMLPPGICFNAISEKALAASKNARLPRSYWDWHEMLKANELGFFAYTPATNLLFGLREAIHMLHEEGLGNVFSRHARYAEAIRAAVRAWDLEIVCEEPHEYSSALTAVLMPEGHDANHLRSVILGNFDMSLGAGLSRLAGKVFRVGHLGSLNDLMLTGTLCGVEMGLQLAGVPHKQGGIAAALTHLVKTATGNIITSP
jgi:alanine-glyoxylate transaminase/serine-glyoxylate transaminase/serine-pyruvate transaminase